MQHIILRCKHCQKEYEYCTHGNGPKYGTEAGCSMEYCAECQTAINKALGKIPVKFEARPFKFEEPRILKLFEKLRKQHEEEMKNENSFFPLVLSMGCSRFSSDYDEFEVIYHNGKKFEIGWNDENPEEKHVAVYMEYDLINNEFTKRAWRFKDMDSYHRQRNVMKRFIKDWSGKSDIDSQAMASPQGDLLYMDYNFDYQTNESSDKKPEPKPHELKTWTLYETGHTIKSRLEYGFDDTSVELEEGISSDGLLDFIDYSVTYSQYIDENTAKITKIECI